MSINHEELRCRVLTKADYSEAAVIAEKLELDLSLLGEFFNYPQNLAFIAEYRGEAAGFVYGYSLMSLEAAPQLFVYSVDVLPEYQNMGIGSRLFRFVVDYSRDNGFSECFVMTDKGNKSACRIYEKAGGKNDYDDEIIYVVKHG